MKKDIQKAIDRVGGAMELVRRFRENGQQIKRQAVYSWIAAGRVPPKRAIMFEKVTGVHRHFLNPDIYPDKPKEFLIANPPPAHPLRRATDPQVDVSV